MDEEDQLNDETFGSSNEEIQGDFDFSGNTAKFAAVVAPKKVPKTLEEIEAELTKTSISGSKKEEQRGEKVLAKAPAIYSDAIGAEIEEKSNDPNKGLMTKEDKDYISRIQAFQLTSDNPELDDYYYLAYSKSKQDDSHQKTLYLPLPTIDLKKKKPQIVDISLKGALGKIAFHSIRSMRPILQMSSKPVTEESSGTVNHQVLQSIESVYSNLIELEKYPNNAEAISSIISEFNLDSASKDSHFPKRFLSYRKGKKVCKKVLALLNPIQKLSFFINVLNSLEELDVISQGDNEQVELFIQNIMMPLAPILSDAEAPLLLSWMTTLLEKPKFLTIVYSKVGIVLLCVFLSRGEILKAEETPNFADPWASLVDKLYSSLAGNFNDLFPHTNESAYYVWQFLSLLVYNIKVEQRHSLVVEVREKVLQTVSSNNPTWIDELNIFLNSMGLDASQLSA